CLSGGGSNGSFQAGAIKYLVGAGRKYEVFTGVSVGAINAAHMAMYNQQASELAASSLVKLWENLRTKDVYKRWFPFGKLHALWKQSLYNTEPLQQLIRNNLKPEQILKNKNELRVGAVSLTSGEYK